MSYCRVGKDSDVYLIAAIDGTFHCFGAEGSAHLSIMRIGTRTAVMRHLAHHRDMGDKVPKRAFQRIVDEFVAEGETHAFHR